MFHLLTYSLVLQPSLICGCSSLSCIFSYLRFLFTLSSNLNSGHHTLLLPAGLPSNNLLTTLSFPIPITWPNHSTILLPLILLYVSHYTVVSTHHSFLFSTFPDLFSIQMCLSSFFFHELSVSVKGQVSLPYSTISVAILLYILIFPALLTALDFKMCFRLQQNPSTNSNPSFDFFICIII